MSRNKQNLNNKKPGRILTHDTADPLPEIPDTNYAKCLLDLFEQYGDKPALTDAKTEKSYSYRELHQMVIQLSNGLKSAGVKYGDCILLASVNNIDYQPIVLAIMLMGATCVPVSPTMTTDEFIHVIQSSQSKWAIVNSNITDKVKTAFRNSGTETLHQLWVIEDGDGAKGNRSIRNIMKNQSSTILEHKMGQFDSSKTIAILPFSSGTTGLPKGVMLTHRNLLTVHARQKYVASQNPIIEKVYTRVLIFLPMYHMYGFIAVHYFFMYGGQSVILNKFTPKDFFGSIQKYKISFLPVVPYIIKFMLETPMIDQYDLSSLNLFTTGSSSMGQDALDGIMVKSGVLAVNAYAMTESCTLGFVKYGPPGFKPNSVGKIAPYLEAKIVDVETGEILAEGEEGEVCLRGPSIMVGYANNPKATAETLDADGWLHTGDLAYYDDDDYLYITDRIKDVIKVKSHQVSPAEIENILNELEEVNDVAVVGIPHEKLGEAPRAWVVPKPGANIDPQKLVKYVADRVVPYKQLVGGVEIIEKLPLNHMGKVLKRTLRTSFTNSRSKL